MRITKIIFFIIILVFLTPIAVNAVTSNENSIDLSVEPGKVLFDLTNVKPGDSVVRNFKVMNKGNKDFNYVINNSFRSGSEKFYNELLLEIKDSQKNIVFKGNLKDFKKTSNSVLKSKTTDELYFLIKIPMELNNDFQGLKCQFEFKVYVEGTLGGVLPADGPKLPNTATGMFNLMAIGIALIIGGFTLISFLKKKSQDIKST
ncbi:TasA family protein [Mesobacillus sp. S13]|uniref:TasA family protein n=1 Tax=Mesobacillus sp. S13 TaxID=2880221 RepID=UPI001CF29AC7|nr:TasA family protein [Mesobacillus sp. S13]